jgi:hypothetical protein
MTTLSCSEQYVSGLPTKPLTYQYFCSETSIAYTMYTPSIQKTKGIIAVLHNITAAQFLKQLGQPLADHLLDLIVLVVLVLVLSAVLLTIVLSSMLLLTTVLLSAPSLATMLLPTMLLTTVLSRIRAATILGMLRRRRHLMHGATLQIDIDPALVLLGLVLEPQFAADLLDAGFDFLDMVARVITLADDDMKVVFASAAGGFDAFFEHVLCFLDEEAVQVDCVVLDAPVCVVLAEDVVARLPVVLLHLRSVLFSLL